MKIHKRIKDGVVTMSGDYPEEWEEYVMAITCPTVQQLLAAGFSLNDANEIIALWRLNHPRET